MLGVYRAARYLFSQNAESSFDELKGLLSAEGIDYTDTTEDLSTFVGVANVAAANVVAFRKTDGIFLVLLGYHVVTCTGIHLLRLPVRYELRGRYAKHQSARHSQRRLHQLCPSEPSADNHWHYGLQCSWVQHQQVATTPGPKRRRYE